MLKGFDYFKNNQKRVSSNVFWYVNKLKMLKKFPLDKMNGTKNTLLFFCELLFIIILLSTCDSYLSWSKRFASRKLCVGFSIFDPDLWILSYNKNFLDSMISPWVGVSQKLA